MPDKFFCDTNIFLYLSLLPENQGDFSKREIIKAFLQVHRDSIYISHQVLNEISNVLLKKRVLSTGEINDFLVIILDMSHFITATPEITFDAIAIKERYGFSFYDSLIVAAAFAGNCNVLVTEDLQHQQIISYESAQLQVINPFNE